MQNPANASTLAELCNDLCCASAGRRDWQRQIVVAAAAVPVLRREEWNNIRRRPGYSQRHTEFRQVLTCIVLPYWRHTLASMGCQAGS